MAEPEVAEHDDGGDREGEQSRERADEEEDAFDDRDPERDREASLSEPAPRAALAMFDDRGLEHAATLPSRLRQPGRPVEGHQLARLDGTLSFGEEAVDDGPRSGNVRPERAREAKFVRDRRRGQVVRGE